MAFYYPQDVPRELGPTAILPASQYYESGDQAHQRDELPLCGAAGTVTVVHYDLWHREMAATSGRHRYMVKFLFTRMSEPRAAAWDHRAAAFDTADDDPPAALRRRMWDWIRAAEWSPAAAGGLLERWALNRSRLTPGLVHAMVARSGPMRMTRKDTLQRCYRTVVKQPVRLPAAPPVPFRK